MVGYDCFVKYYNISAAYKKCLVEHNAYHLYKGRAQKGSIKCYTTWLQPKLQPHSVAKMHYGTTTNLYVFN